MEITLIVFGLVLALLGLFGCILPVIPGPPLSYLSLILLSIARDWQPFSAMFLVLMAIVMAAVLLMDYIFPLAGAKKYGASKFGLWGSVLGIILGLFIFPPWGMIFGAFLGACIGELLAGKDSRAALRAGWGVFVGNLASTGVKLTYAAVVLFFFIKTLF
jgi:uncharacterized protein YqgC (DUF456 family)